MDKSEAYSRIKEGTQCKILSAFAEIAVPARPPIKNAEDAHKVMEKWDEFQVIRELINKTNRDIWSEIEKINKLDNREIPEFVIYFEEMLKSRINTINSQIKLIDFYTEKEKSKRSWKIFRALILTIGSIAPGTGALDSLLDYFYDRFIIGADVENVYPYVKGIFEYERVLNSLSLSKEPIPPLVSVSKQYTPISYWDK